MLCDIATCKIYLSLSNLQEVPWAGKWAMGLSLVSESVCCTSVKCVQLVPCWNPHLSTQLFNLLDQELLITSLLLELNTLLYKVKLEYGTWFCFKHIFFCIILMSCRTSPHPSLTSLSWAFSRSTLFP